MFQLIIDLIRGKKKLKVVNNPNFKPKKKSIIKSKIENWGIRDDIQDIVILAAGPSLTDSLTNEKVLNFLQNKRKCIVNLGVEDKFFNKIKPEYWVIMDPQYGEKDISDFYKDKYTKILNILKSVDWKITIFMPKILENYNFLIEVPKENKNINIVYINTMPCSDKLAEEEKFEKYKTNESMPIPYNVIIGCFYTSINIGFKNIYLLGADHNWTTELFVGNDNIVYYNSQHFYDGKEKKISKLYSNANELNTTKIGDFLSALGKMFQTYHEVRRYATFIGGGG